jgi:uncharacterized protein
MRFSWWNEWVKRARQALAAVGAAALASCGTTQATPEAAETAAVEQGPRPALWKLADADTTIYLFGTIHLLPEGLDWRTPVLAQAIAESDALVLETVLEDQMKAAQAMMAAGISPGQPPILERVPAERRDALAEVIETSGVPMALLDRMETWAAGLTLLAVSFQQLGLDPELGVEKGLTGSYKAADKPVTGLETVEEQFGFFDNLSEESQRLFLASVADDASNAKKEFAAMLDAWTAGDTEAIARTFDDEASMSPELREVLMTKRNAAWADWLAKRLEQPGTVMVAVGAGHLAGRDSVQAMLAQKGLETQRVQ